MSRYTIRFTGTAQRSLVTLPEKIATAALEFIAGPLAENPHRVGKPLMAPYEGLHGARRGEYRVIYEIFDDVIQIDVVDIGHRRDIYRPR